ncbi:MAG TPA: Ig-like domain-containing protein, partial [Acidobacteriaceae bacterium]
GDSNVAAASTSLTETIVSATTQIALAASTVLSSYNTPLTLTATETSKGGSPAGPVTFTADGVAIANAALNSQGIASLMVTTLSPGTHSVVASYAGDARERASISSPVSVTVKQTTAIVVESSVNPALTLSSIVLTARLTNEGAAVASGTIVFSDGSTQLGTAPLDANGNASITIPSLAAGVHRITASYAGDADDFAATSSPFVETVNLRTSTTSLTASHTDSSDPQQVTLIAVVQASGTQSATGTVGFMNGNVELGMATVDGTGVATLTIELDQSQTAENVVAQYSGDVVFAASNSAATAVQAGPATQFTLAITPAAVNVISKQHTAISLSLSSVAGFSDTIQLGCLGLPYAATCVFSQPEAKLGANGTANVQLTLDTGDPLGLGAQSSARLKNRSTGVLVCILPGALLGSLLCRRRRLPFLLVYGCIAFLTMTISGCSGLQGTGTPAGTYTFKVTASGQGSGATQSQVVTLTVTQ